MTALLQDVQSASSIRTHVIVSQSEIVDAAIGRRDPAGEFARLSDPLHQALDKVAIGVGRQPFALLCLPQIGGDRISPWIRLDPRPSADRAPESQARQNEPKVAPGFLDQAV